jgi:hypothetical protein
MKKRYLKELKICADFLGVVLVKSEATESKDWVRGKATVYQFKLAEGDPSIYHPYLKTSFYLPRVYKHEIETKIIRVIFIGALKRFV